MISYEKIKNLPITSHLDEICQELKNSSTHIVVLTAETGAGKSTALPLALFKNFENKIIMMEPRRMSVINVADRVSSLLGESIGNTCGYKIHLDKKISGRTRIEIVTENIFVRTILSDPLLEGISVVVLDEFHERSVNLDLSLALLRETMSLRDDLYVVIMSATLNENEISQYWGEKTGLDSSNFIKIEGRTFPVKIEYSEKNVEEVIKLSLNDKLLIEGGSILVFLPGLRDINNVKANLEELYLDENVEIYKLHSSVPIKEQVQLFRSAQSGTIRIILSSSIAETSVTIPDVKIVIDSGLGKYNYFDKKQQMNRLQERRISEFSATQRTGRAGRLCDGKCIRLWNPNEKLIDNMEPEILRIDLSSLVLECFDWGISDINQLKWLTTPSITSWNAAKKLLEELDCIKDGLITELGRAVLEMGIDIRIACVALSGIIQNKFKLSTGLAMNLLSASIRDRNFLEKQGLDVEKRVQKNCGNSQLIQHFSQKFTDFSTGNALLCGYPDRLAVRVVDNSKNNCEYMFPSGRIGYIIDKDNKSTPVKAEFIIATAVDAGESKIKIYDYVILDKKDADYFFDRNSVTVEQVEFVENKVEKTKIRKYGSIILQKKKIPVSDDDYKKAIYNEVRNKGIECLPLSEKTKSLLIRYRFYIQNSPETENKFENMASSVEDWLSPFFLDKKLSEENVNSALKWYLDSATIDEKVPLEIKLNTGKKLKIKYEEQNGIVIPTCDIIIQQLFGCYETPKIMDFPVLLRLLSPARRPLQVTKDLGNFWKETWPQICSEMKGRYPKHNWDYKIVEMD